MLFKSSVITAFLLFIHTIFGVMPAYNGAGGYIIAPSAEVSTHGSLGITARYTYNNMLTPALNFSLVDHIEIGAGWDINFGSGVYNPVLLSAKIKLPFENAIALGFTAELFKYGDTYANYYSPYGCMQETIKGFDTTLGLGYTFDRQRLQWGNINFFIGFKKEIIAPYIILMGDFANFPYKHNRAPALRAIDSSRGIVNLGVRFLLTEKIALDVMGLDLMDSNRNISAGMSVLLGLAR